jgi:hypothetical protein
MHRPESGIDIDIELHRPSARIHVPSKLGHEQSIPRMRIEPCAELRRLVAR